MIPYIVWIPALILLTMIWAVIGKHVNDHPSSPLYYFLFLSIPMWAIVCRYSQNLVFDSVIYDVVMTIVYTGTFILLGAGASFTAIQWIGALIAVIGLTLMKVHL